MKLLNFRKTDVPKRSIPLRCRWNWHPWGRWSESFDQPVRQKVWDAFFRMYTREWESIIEVQQKRICTGCGQEEYRKVDPG